MVAIRVSAREAILDAGFAVFVDAPAASLADIAAHAGVGRATLHRYFTSRDTLLAALAKTAMDELSFAVDAAVSDAESHEDALKHAMRAIIDRGDRHVFLARVPLADAVATVRAADQAELAAVMRGAQDDGALDRSVSADWLAAAFDGLIGVGWAMVRSGDATRRQAADFAWKMFIAGARPEGQR